MNNSFQIYVCLKIYAIYVLSVALYSDKLTFLETDFRIIKCNDYVKLQRTLIKIVVFEIELSLCLDKYIRINKSLHSKNLHCVSLIKRTPTKKYRKIL